MDQIHQKAVELLKQLISTSSFSREEDKTADILYNFFVENGIPPKRLKNNVWAVNENFKEDKPTIILNSHHDTVKPSAGYTLDPFTPIEKDGKLFGLGSNDAGGPLVSLIAAFLHFYKRDDLSFNLLMACTAEEEISGANGIALLLKNVPYKIDFGIVGEPTSMDMAVAEKGLMVIDCTAQGISGHAARNEGENAILNAIKDIQKLENLVFEKESEYLGPVKISTTVINAGSAHNVVPDRCTFTLDCRTTDAYRNEEVLEKIKSVLQSEVKARSTRLQPSFIDPDHKLLQAAKELGFKFYGSPTLSDQALMPFPTVKLGPGDSARSHTADEFIYTHQIKQGIERYVNLINNYQEILK